MAPQNAALTLFRAPKAGKKYFTVVEADKALAYVRPVTRDLMDCYAHVVDIRRRIEKPREQDNREHLEADYESTMDHLSELVDELHQVGVELKDFERGLIDFPAVHDGREIYLCWQFKEQSVCAWHETDAGFAGRQDVAVLDDDKSCDKAA
ncbi:MAG: DUF2203 domain-containing protein [Phycisphaeraceae bacterium]|nr:DUF2203 domain-containing protein [Phycisphaeraceae bacterium]